MIGSKFSEWWKNNPDKSEKIKDRRRKRYAEDPIHAERERERKRKAYAEKKRQEASPGPRLPKPKLIWHEERMVEVWSVGRVAAHLEVHKRTISSLEARRAIPTNRTVDSIGRRWWPAEFVEWLKGFFDLRKTGKLSPQEFSTRVWNEWKNERNKSSMPVMGKVENDHTEDEDDKGN